MTGIDPPKASFGLSTSRTRAIKAARERGGYVMVVRYGLAYGAPSSWDAPTFKVSADLVADFRRAGGCADGR